MTAQHRQLVGGATLRRDVKGRAIGYLGRHAVHPGTGREHGIELDCRALDRHAQIVVPEQHVATGDRVDVGW